MKPGTPLTSIVAPPANHATPTRSPEATDNASFDEKVAFMACPIHAADTQAVVAKRATF
ncbi:hypothetical protein BDR05DRAFT_968099 [Suillus weaverae]|nr:hypothetical protein BDR05DRAFT_968099 [Suillus weaverae]